MCNSSRKVLYKHSSFNIIFSWEATKQETIHKKLMSQILARKSVRNYFMIILKGFGYKTNIDITGNYNERKVTLKFHREIV